MATAFAIITGYLLGSIPSAYLVARLVKGIDIREYGTRTVSTSNVLFHVGRAAAVVVAAMDLTKAALPPALALAAGLGLRTAVLAGVAAVIGHNWSAFLRFQGGRGVGPTIAMLFVVAWREALILGVIFVIGSLLGAGPVVVLVSMLGLPLLAQAMGEPPEVVAGTVVIAVVVILKRLLANDFGRDIPPERRWEVLRYRLLLDRDIRDECAWVEQRPSETGKKS
jgi:glycerol-3-phosphate acyltransferase PlsY